MAKLSKSAKANIGEMERKLQQHNLEIEKQSLAIRIALGKRILEQIDSKKSK